MKNLVIVESKAKAKTIEKYLSSSDQLKHHGTFHVVASMGHVVDLPPKYLGIDTKEWTMNYVPITGKQEIIKNLKSLIKSHDMIYLAADPDREGEAIAKNLYDVLKLKASSTRRITFHEITQKAIVTAIQNPRDIDQCLVDAQETRRILDRVVGYKLSPLLWRRFASSGLSAGRVQSVALKLVVDRSKEIEDFKPSLLWKVHGIFEMGDKNNNTKLETILEESLKDKKELERLMRELAKKGGVAKWKVMFTSRNSKNNPLPPFITSTLQQEAYTRYHIPGKRTMQLAQALYEEGHITYMRTDSTNISEDAKTEIHKYIITKFSADHVVDRIFKTRVANAQEAHECIRPTHIEKTSRDIVSDKLTADHKKIYDLIWRCAVASQMSPAIYVEFKTSVTANCSDMPILNERIFIGTSRILIEKGYLEIWNPDADVQIELANHMKDRVNKANTFQDIFVIPKDFHAEGDMTRPHSLYNEPSLVKSLEKESIGRPSTYATIIEKLFSKGYIVRGMNPQSTENVVHYKVNIEKKQVSIEEDTIVIGGKETDRMVPTSLGERVSFYLEEIAPKTLDVNFTANMEELLDKISNNEIKKKDMLNEFYKGFEQLVEDALTIQKKVREELAKEKKQNPEKAAEKQPSLQLKNVIKQISDDVTIIQTRYGPTILVSSQEKFIGLMPFLKWKEKTINNLTKKDVYFLLKLPIIIDDNIHQEKSIEILMGKFGLYAKKDSVNYRISKEIWNDFYEYNPSIHTYKYVSKYIIAPKEEKKKI